MSGTRTSQSFTSAVEIPALALVVVAGAPTGFAQSRFDGELADELESARGKLARGEPCAIEGGDPKLLVALARAHHVRIVWLQLGGALQARALARQGIRHAYSVAADVTIVRTPMPADRRRDHGPFDIIGDVHGCVRELDELLVRLGYVGGRHPSGRKAVFLGDLVDRGPDVHGVVTRVMKMAADGDALCVPGNHEVKLARKLRQAPAVMPELADFIEALPSHYVLDGGALVVAHAGLPASMHGRDSGAVRAFCHYGETTGETDEYGLPVRADWAARYDGAATVVYGHTPVAEAKWVNGTICIDTGCVYGGALTALRWPECELVSVPAERMWYEPVSAL